MAVITISRQYGSGGDEIADRVCQIMDYRHFDKRLIAKSAMEAGITDQEIIDYSEDNHKMRSFFDKLFGRTRTVGKISYWKEDSHGTRITDVINLSDEYALSLVCKAIEAAYQAGNTVILGRGGQMILKDRPDVLHVRVEAPLEERIQRVKASLVTEQRSSQELLDIRRAAQDLIEQRDLASADYLKSYYNVDWADPLLYHVVINSARFNQEQSAQIIAEMAMRLQPVQA
jgi:cytidylate kinase